MRIVLAHFKDQTLQHLRAPGYLLPTLAMPALFYFLFEGEDREVGLVTFLMASFAMWAVLGVAFFQFGWASPRSGPRPGSGSYALCRCRPATGWRGGASRRRCWPRPRRRSWSARRT